MPILALQPAESDLLYKLLGHPEAWESETEEIRGTLKKLSANTVFQDNQLMKMVDSKPLTYIRLIQRVTIILQARRSTGHGGVQKLQLVE